MYRAVAFDRDRGGARTQCGDPVERLFELALDPDYAHEVLHCLLQFLVDGVRVFLYRAFPERCERDFSETGEVGLSNLRAVRAETGGERGRVLAGPLAENNQVGKGIAT